MLYNTLSFNKGIKKVSLRPLLKLHGTYKVYFGN